MSDLVALLGKENLERLSSAVGGTRLFIPKHFGKPPGGGRDGSERLVRLLGEPLAILLVFHFGEGVIYVPRAGPRGSINPERLKRLVRQGLTNKEIARRFGCSERAVEKRRAKSRSNDNGKERKERRA